MLPPPLQEPTRAGADKATRGPPSFPGCPSARVMSPRWSRTCASARVSAVAGVSKSYDCSKPCTRDADVVRPFEAARSWLFPPGSRLRGRWYFTIGWSVRDSLTLQSSMNASEDEPAAEGEHLRWLDPEGRRRFLPRQTLLQTCEIRELILHEQADAAVHLGIQARSSPSVSTITRDITKSASLNASITRTSDQTGIPETGSGAGTGRGWARWRD